MDTEKSNMESVFSRKIRAGRRRTYFFDVRQTKGNDYYLTLTESTRRFNGTGYERHKIFLYKEDFNRFLATLEETINHVKTDLMPDFDYDEFTRRHEEYEKRKAEEALQDAEAGENSGTTTETTTSTEEGSTAGGEAESTAESTSTPDATESSEGSESVEAGEDMSW